MHRAIAHLPPNHGRGAAFDSIILAHNERRLRRKLLVAKGGTEIMVDFANTLTLDHMGALELEDGRLVEVQAAVEPLYEIQAPDRGHLLRIAWHIGNRHTSAQLEEGRILIKRDHVLKTMLEGLGAKVRLVDEPFFAERGAYHSHGHEDHALLARRP